MKKKLRKVDVLVYVLISGFVLLIILTGLQVLVTERGYWQVEVGNEGPHLALTLRLAGTDSGSQSRRVVFQDVESSKVKPGTFQLPDEADQMSGIRMTFHDITLRPGRVTFELEGHEIDMMLHSVTIDSVSYDWDQVDPIVVGD